MNKSATFFATAAVAIAGCATPATPPPAGATNLASYHAMLPLLETNCAHCHGAQRIPGMPPLTDTRALSTLIGSGKIIVPGAPERSRFYTVVALSDNEAGAMPPTGHAVSKRELEALRKWIAAGAPVPDGVKPIIPRGMAPRSR
jgi:mono/diheme cytochrome c family protein